MTQNNELQTLSLEEIDSLNATEALQVIQKVESNTKWEDTAEHMTTNGFKTTC